MPQYKISTGGKTFTVKSKNALSQEDVDQIVDQNAGSQPAEAQTSALPGRQMRPPPFETARPVSTLAPLSQTPLSMLSMPEQVVEAPRPEMAAQRQDPEAMALLAARNARLPQRSTQVNDPEFEARRQAISQPQELLTDPRINPVLSGMFNAPGAVKGGAERIGKGLSQLGGRPFSRTATEAMAQGDPQLMASEMGLPTGPLGIGVQGQSVETSDTPEKPGGVLRGLTNIAAGGAEAAFGMAMGVTPTGALFSTANNLAGMVSPEATEALMAPSTTFGMAEKLGVKDPELAANLNSLGDIGINLLAMHKMHGGNFDIKGVAKRFVEKQKADFARASMMDRYKAQQTDVPAGGTGGPIPAPEAVSLLGTILPNGEKVTRAAVRIAGNLFVGPSHYDAMADAAKRLNIDIEDLYTRYANIPQGFITDKGTFLSRQQALDAAQKSGQLGTKAEGVSARDAEAKQKFRDVHGLSSEELRGEQLAATAAPGLEKLARKFTHYSREPRTELDPRFLGTGRASEELGGGIPKNKFVSVYDESAGAPEPSVARGAVKHKVEGKYALLDLASEEGKQILQKAGGDLNKLNGLIKRAGYDGYNNTESQLPQAYRLFGKQKATALPSERELRTWESGPVLREDVADLRNQLPQFKAEGYDSFDLRPGGSFHEHWSIPTLMADGAGEYPLTPKGIETAVRQHVMNMADRWDDLYAEEKGRRPSKKFRQEMADEFLKNAGLKMDVGGGEAIKKLVGIGSRFKREELLAAGMKHKVDPEAVTKNIALKRGGFTLFSDGTPATDGFSVALGADKQVRLPATATDAEVTAAAKKIMTDNKGAYAKHPDLGVGGWTEGDTMYIEPVKITMTPEQATFVGKATDQKSHADLSRTSVEDFGDATFTQLGGADKAENVLRQLPSDLNLRMKVLNARLEREAGYKKVRGEKGAIPYGKGGREVISGEPSLRDAMEKAAKYNEEVLGLPPLPMGDVPYEQAFRRYHDLTLEPLKEAFRREKEEGRPSGKDWYGENMRKFDEEFLKDNPGVTPAELKLIKTMGSPISAGTPVADEVRSAVTAFKWWKATGKMPEYQPESWNAETGDYVYKTNAETGEPRGWNAYTHDAAKKLRMIGDMIKEKGGDVQKVIDFMESSGTLEEMQKIAPSRVGMLEKGMPMRGAEGFFGPKTGPYTLDKIGAETEGLAKTSTQDTHMARSKLGQMGLGVVTDKDGTVRPVDARDMTPEIRRQMMQMDIDMARAIGEETGMVLQPKQIQAVDWGIQRDFAERNGEYVDKRGSAYDDSYAIWKKEGGLDRLNESIRKSVESGREDADTGTVPPSAGKGKGEARPDIKGDAFEGEGGDTDFDFSLSPKDKLKMSLLPGLPDPTLGGKPGETVGKYAGSINVNRMDLTDEQKKKLHADFQSMKGELEGLVGRKLTDEDVRLAAEDATPFAEILSFDIQKKVAAGVLKLRQLVAEGAAEGKLTREYYENFIALQAIAKFAGRLLQKFGVEADPRMASVGEEAIGKLPQNNKLMVQVLEKIAESGANMDEVVRIGESVDWKNAKEVAQFYRTFVKPTARELFTEFRYINMLSSPLTHVINFSSNLGQAVFLAPLTKGLTGLLSKKHTAAEAPAFLRGAAKSLPEAVSRATDVFMGKQTTANLDVNQIRTMGKARNRLLIPVAKFNQAFGSVTRALEASDQFWQTIAKGGELESRIKQAEKIGLDPLQEMTRLNAEAMDAARKWVFRDPLDPLNKTGQGTALATIDAVTKQIMSARSYEGKGTGGKIAAGAANFFMPFVATPMNILKRGIEYSPAGFITMIKSGDKATAFSKALIGSSVFAGAAGIVANNESTWAVPNSPGDRADFYAQGKIPYSIKLGGKWYSYNKLGPLAYPIALAAAWKEYANDPKYKDMGGRIAAGIAGYAKFFADQSYVQGLADLTKNLEGDPRAFLESTPSNFMRQMVPVGALQNWVNSFIDPNQRIPDGPFDRVALGIPGLSQTVTKRYTPLGAEAKKPGAVENWLNLSPIKQATESKDPVVRAIGKLKLKIGVPSRVVYGENLDEERYQQYVRNVGESIRESIGEMVTDPDFARSPKDDQQDAVDDIVRKARKAVKQQMFEDLRDRQISREGEASDSEE